MIAVYAPKYLPQAMVRGRGAGVGDEDWRGAERGRDCQREGNELSKLREVGCGLHCPVYVVSGRKARVGRMDRKKPNDLPSISALANDQQHSKHGYLNINLYANRSPDTYFTYSKRPHDPP